MTCIFSNFFYVLPSRSSRAGSQRTVLIVRVTVISDTAVTTLLRCCITITPEKFKTPKHYVIHIFFSKNDEIQNLGQKITKKSPLLQNHHKITSTKLKISKITTRGDKSPHLATLVTTAGLIKTPDLAGLAILFFRGSKSEPENVVAK